jgi:RNA polymerase sigma-70 factor (ECF subfamily)
MANLEERDVEASLRRQLARGATADAAAGTISAYGPQILAYLRTILQDGDDADDAFSRFAENLWRSIAKFRGECSFKTWSYKIAWHAALRITREPHRRRGERLATTEAGRLAEAVRSTGSWARSAMQDRLERVRDQLAPDEQTILILRFDRDLSWPEVAEVLAEAGTTIEEATLRKRFERLKQKLRKMALDEGLPTD